MNTGTWDGAVPSPVTLDTRLVTELTRITTSTSARSCYWITSSPILTIAVFNTVDSIVPPCAGLMTEHPSPPCLGAIAGPILFRTSCLVLTLALTATVEAIFSYQTRLLAFLANISWGTNAFPCESVTILG